MRQPITEGEHYRDCSNRIAVATEVTPLVFNLRQRIWYFLTGDAPHWDVIGQYDPADVEPGEFSNVSWRHCGCERVKEVL